MKTLAIAIQKGGQGKTFIACNLAFDLVRKNKKVLFVDLDTQANATYTLNAEESPLDAYQLYSDDAKSLIASLGKINTNLTVFKSTPELANIEQKDFLEARESLFQNLHAISDLFDICIFDTPPSLGIVMTSAISSSDYLVSPVQLELYSINGVEQLLTIVANLRDVNPNLTYLGMIPNLVDMRRKAHKEDLIELRKIYGHSVFSSEINNREVNAAALAEQKPLWEIPRFSAKIAEKEFLQVANEIYTKINL